MKTVKTLTVLVQAYPCFLKNEKSHLETQPHINK
jgi:hypothetical protein